MSRKNTVKSMTISLIIFFGLLFLISNLCYSQYTTIGYPLYLNWEYPGSYSMFGMYDSSYGTMTSFSMMNGLDSIYGPDGIYGLNDIHSGFNVMEMTGGLFSVYNILGGLGIISRPDNIYSNYGSLGMIGGTALIFSGLNSLDMIGEGNTLSTTGGFGESPGLGGLGGLAGVDRFGSRAGLIGSEATDITTYWDI